MSNDLLYIPEKIKVGYQNRSDTYTSKLAYITYFDEKGILRKEKSWESWRDKKIAAHEFDNEPTEGLVLNKKVGGGRYGWNPRGEWIRVYDPRGFEFEINIANLLFILSEVDCSRGKGLEGKFVYAWDKTQLILLPVGSQEYIKSTTFTNLKSCKISKKDLVKGCVYTLKDTTKGIYIGEEMYYNNDYWQGNSYKAYIFLVDKKYEPHKNLNQIALKDGPDIVSNYPQLYTKYKKSKNGSAAKSLKLVSGDRTILKHPTKEIYCDRTDTRYISAYIHFIENGKLTYTAEKVSELDKYICHKSSNIEVVLESGASFPFRS